MKQKSIKLCLLLLFAQPDSIINKFQKKKKTEVVIKTLSKILINSSNYSRLNEFVIIKITQQV